MNLDRNDQCRHIHFVSTLAMPLCLFLSACGGDGTSTVESIPPPPVTPTPTPTVDVQTSWLDSPATRVGTYDVIGRLTFTPGNGDPTSYRAVSPGEFTMTSAQPVASMDFAHELDTPAGLLPGGLTSSGKFESRIFWDINVMPPSWKQDPYGDWDQLLGQRLTAFSKAADGSETKLFSYDDTRGLSGSFQTLSSGNSLRGTLYYDIGYSYVAMGEWSWKVVDPNYATVPRTDSGDLLFVNGDRTPDAGIPISGTASYDAHTLTLWSNGGPGIPFALTADFGARTISTRIDQDYLYTSGADAPTLGIHVGGSAPFGNNGLFDIPLAGTANYSSTNTPVTPPSQSVTGDMNGAFFGPHAEQVGGTFSLQNSGGTVMMQDAFVGQQRH